RLYKDLVDHPSFPVPVRRQSQDVRQGWRRIEQGNWAGNGMPWADRRPRDHPGNHHVLRHFGSVAAFMAAMVSLDEHMGLWWQSAHQAAQLAIHPLSLA